MLAAVNFIAIFFFLNQMPSRYTVPLREGIDFRDLVQGDGTMFETDLDNMGRAPCSSYLASEGGGVGLGRLAISGFDRLKKPA